MCMLLRRMLLVCCLQHDRQFKLFCELSLVSPPPPLCVKQSFFFRGYKAGEPDWVCVCVFAGDKLVARAKGLSVGDSVGGGR